MQMAHEKIPPLEDRRNELADHGMKWPIFWRHLTTSDWISTLAVGAAHRSVAVLMLKVIENSTKPEPIFLLQSLFSCQLIYRVQFQRIILYNFENYFLMLQAAWCPLQVVNRKNVASGEYAAWTRCRQFCPYFKGANSLMIIVWK